MTLSSEQLEREAERARAQIADTLDELRSRISPGQVVDEIVDYAREGGIGDFARNLGNEVRTNPLPVALIGAGLAWLMMANGRSARQAGNAADGLSESARTAAGAMSGAASSAASQVSDAAGRVQSAASSLGEAASSGYHTAAQSAAAAAQRLGDGTAAISRSAAEAGRSAADASRNFFDYAKEQPLVLAGIGLALGAALGAALPSTDAENRLMGEASDAVKDSAADVAAEQYQKVQAVAEKAIEEAARAAEDQGLGKSERLETALDTHRESSVVPSGDEGVARPDEVHARS